MVEQNKLGFFTHIFQIFETRIKIHDEAIDRIIGRSSSETGIIYAITYYLILI